MSRGYFPNFDIDRVRGEKAEELYRRLRTAILSGAAEVKRDDRASETGNFYIEHEAWTVNGWRPSGIDNPEATHTVWVFVCWPFVVAAPTWMVRRLSERARVEGPIGECRDGSHPTKGALVALKDFLPWLAEFAHEATTEKEAA